MAEEARKGRGDDSSKGSREPSGPAAPPFEETEQANERWLDQVRRAQQGDVLAMSEVLDRLAPWVARICGGIALQHGEDAAQETLVQVFRDLRTLREPAAFFGFARRIAVREAIRHARLGRRAGNAALADDSSAESAAARATLSAAGGSDPALARDVRAVLEGLTPEQRGILVLRDLEGFSEAEAATQLGVALGTVKSRLARARAAFAKRWSE